MNMMPGSRYSIALTALILGSCASGIPVKFPQYPSGNQGAQLQRVLDGKRKIAVVARDLPAGYSTDLTRLGLASEWQDTMRSSIQSAMQTRGFYSIVDLDSRSTRYQELAHAQSGMTRNQLAIGKELAVESILFVRMTALPRVECKVEEITDLSTAALQLAMAAANKGQTNGEAQYKKPTGVTYLTVFVEATLVNVETGRSISYSNTKPHRLENDVGNLQCPSQLKAFDEALEQIGTDIASNLSPEVVTFYIPLADDVDGLRGGDPDRVAAFLEEGIKWAEEGNFDEAARQWERALDESGGTSTSAMWNLGAYYWYSGDMDQAQQYFEQAMRTAEPGWMDDKRYVWTLFQKEKDRVAKEGY
ncbi:MAG: hypothetical protein KDK37_02690 [Leptospiraceae bacterium]|nr:hypothetical protein [Leptospiraceae bacterium]